MMNFGIFGITIFSAGVLLLLALLTYSPEDPNFIFPENTKIENILGFHGSYVSDLFFQSIGLISFLFSFTLIVTGINIIRSKEFFLIIENIFFTIIYCILGTLFFAHFYSNTPLKYKLLVLVDSSLARATTVQIITFALFLNL